MTGFDAPNSERTSLGRRGRAAVALWLAAIAWSWWLLTADAFRTEGASAASPPAVWPADSQLPRATDRATLIVFLHPKCPCSQATITELALLLRNRPATRTEDLAVRIVATSPVDGGASWTSSPLLERSQRLPLAQLFVDYGGAEARRFGAQASGTVMLFDAAGRRQFCGGVTASRGHEGFSGGADALGRLLADGSVSAATFPAFGCRLVGSDPCTPLASATIAPRALAGSPGNGPGAADGQSYSRIHTAMQTLARP